MDFTAYKPPWPLSGHIDQFWACSDRPSHERERIVPSGTFEMVFNLVEDEFRIYTATNPTGYKRFSGAMVSGTYTGSFVIDPAQHRSIIGVHFKPGGAVPFLGIPAHEVADAHIDLASLWGPSAHELRERMATAKVTATRFRILQESLTRRLAGSAFRNDALLLVLGLLDDSEVRVRDVARRVEMSPRRLIQNFSSEVGLTPKMFARIRRFQRVLDAVTAGTTPVWPDIAAQYGFYDQSHLIREFRAFSGLSPASYYARGSDGVLKNHLPQID